MSNIAYHFQEDPRFVPLKVAAFEFQRAPTYERAIEGIRSAKRLGFGAVKLSGQLPLSFEEWLKLKWMIETCSMVTLITVTSHNALTWIEALDVEMHFIDYHDYQYALLAQMASFKKPIIIKLSPNSQNLALALNHLNQQQISTLVYGADRSPHPLIIETSIAV